MHPHMYIEDCILDYGPIYSFWLFGFRRYNGMSGSLPTNKRNIKLQIMGQFCCENVMLHLDKLQQYEEHFSNIFNDFNGVSSQRGTLSDIDLVR